MAIDVIHLLKAEGNYSQSVTSQLDQSEVWQAYSRQRHDLFLPAASDTQVVPFVMICCKHWIITYEQPLNCSSDKRCGLHEHLCHQVTNATSPNYKHSSDIVFFKTLIYWSLYLQVWITYWSLFELWNTAVAAMILHSLSILDWKLLQKCIIAKDWSALQFSHWGIHGSSWSCCRKEYISLASWYIIWEI